METWRFGPNWLAEEHDHTKLIWIDAEGEGVKGNDGHDPDGNQQQERTREASAALYHLLELAQTVKMRRGATVFVTVAIAQRHDPVFRCLGGRRDERYRAQLTAWTCWQINPNTSAVPVRLHRAG